MFPLHMFGSREENGKGKKKKNNNKLFIFYLFGLGKKKREIFKKSIFLLLYPH